MYGHEPLDREPRQLVVHERRDFWLTDAEQIGSGRLGEVAFVDDLIQSIGQP